MKNILIIDTETTGLHPEQGAQLIEVGAILFNVQHKEMLGCFSTLLPCRENPVEHINGIKAVVSQQLDSSTVQKSLRTLKELWLQSDYIIAHNAKFDRKFMDNQFYTLIGPWVCTKEDFEWPVPLQRKRLEDICIAMGVDYINAHRALNDCMLLVNCFQKVDDLNNRLDRALQKVTSESMETFR